ncbi:secreted RxLR effector protein 161-like [Nicotiana sylvestris]|uniref:secreted RxLR effector protein 161-like n=1 Tax=Nicotiana sylvestris TaxID=4096 RepID=UPI00388CBF15
MLKEFQALNANKTWDFIPLPTGKKVIPCKWMYKIKNKSDGIIESATHVLRYLLNDPGQGILLSGSFDFSLFACDDFDWVACPTSRRSITGFYITLVGSPISSKSKKHPTISLSSAEVEYRALRKVVAEVASFLHILHGLGCSITPPVSVFCES